MPLYDYRCSACSHEFEVLHGINDDPPNACPVCEKGKVKKMAAAPSFTFKGSGWYKDLYGKPKPKAAAEDAPKPEPSAAKKEKTTTTNKSDA